MKTFPVFHPASGPASSPRIGLLPGLAALLAGVAIMALSARLTIPFWPVPLTMQGLAVLVLGGLLGRLAAPCMLAYVAAGLLGAPVFAAGASGPAVLAGPTGGYLAGFVLAAWFLGRMDLLRSLDIRRVAGCMLTAGAIVLACGSAWLAWLLGLERAVRIGVLPFIAPQLIKVCLATAIVACVAGLRRRSVHAS